jgi:transposase
MRWPEKVRDVWRPPYGPELNPRERVWRTLQEERAWRQFTTLAAPQDAMSDLLQADEASTLPSLPSYT